MKNSMLIRTGAPLVIILIALVITVVMISSRKPPEQTPIEESAFLVDARPVGRETISFDVKTRGNVMPQHQTRLSTEVSGKVVAMSPKFVVGGMVRKGEVLLTLEQSDYITDVEIAEAELARAEAALEEEIALGRVAEEEWRSVRDSAPKLGLRKPQLAREQANVKAAKAGLARAKRNLARTEVRAPYNALIISREVDLGQFINTGSVVGEVYSTDSAEIRLSITDRDQSILDLEQLSDKLNKVDVFAVVGGRAQDWHGEIVRTEGLVDNDSRVIYAVAQIDDPYNRESDNAGRSTLRFGSFVEANIHGTQQVDVFVLPRSVLRLDNTIVTISDSREVKLKPVVVARSDEEYVYIASGLAEGDLVAFSAVPNPFNGMKVRLPGEEPPAPLDGIEGQEEDSTTITTQETE